MPSTTVMAPTTMLESPMERPAERCRKVGTQAEMPPMAKVRVARPKVPVRKAGLRKRPRTVARSAVGRTWSLAPRSGSRPTMP